MKTYKGCIAFYLTPKILRSWCGILYNNLKIKAVHWIWDSKKMKSIFANDMMLTRCLINMLNNINILELLVICDNECCHYLNHHACTWMSPNKIYLKCAQVHLWTHMYSSHTMPHTFFFLPLAFALFFLINTKII